MVLIPILIYQLLFKETELTRKKPYSKLSLLLLIMLYMTMTFPINFKEGYNYDFRIIPVIISFIYAGVTPGLITVSTLFIYRLYLGGDGVYINLFNIMLITSILIFFSLRYESFMLRNKKFIASFVFLVSVIFKILYLFKSHQSDQIQFMTIFYISAWISLLIVVFIIDYVDKHLQIQTELQRAEKLNLISQLAASVAHEVRNPMTAVKGFLQLMSNDKHLPSNHRNYIDISLNELNHAQTIINDYLSLAKPNPI